MTHRFDNVDFERFSLILIETKTCSHCITFFFSGLCRFNTPGRKSSGKLNNKKSSCINSIKTFGIPVNIRGQRSRFLKGRLSFIAGEQSRPVWENK